MLNSNIIWTV